MAPPAGAVFQGEDSLPWEDRLGPQEEPGGLLLEETENPESRRQNPVFKDWSGGVLKQRLSAQRGR